MRILSLDLSTSTGYALLVDGELGEHGNLTVDVENFDAKITKYDQYPADYPRNYIKAARELAQRCSEIIDAQRPDVVVIEEVNQGRNRHSQSLLGFIHCIINEMLEAKGVTTQYLTQQCWRKLVNAYSRKEDRRHNAKVARYKKKHGTKVAKIDGKVVGKLTSKHYSVRVANSTFGLKLIMKDNDVADAICLALAWHLALQKKPSEATE